MVSTPTNRGSALFLTLCVTALVAGLSGVLVSILLTEEAVGRNHHRSVLAAYAADGMLSSVTAELTEIAGWDGVLVGSELSEFRATVEKVTLPAGGVFDVVGETRTLQRQLDTRFRGGGLRWRLFSWGWWSDLIEDPALDRLTYVVAWVRDDIGDEDGDPYVDMNAQIVIRAAAFGPFGVRRAVQATIMREFESVCVVSWQVVR